LEVLDRGPDVFRMVSIAVDGYPPFFSNTPPIPVLANLPQLAHLDCISFWWFEARLLIQILQFVFDTGRGFVGAGASSITISPRSPPQLFPLWVHYIVPKASLS